MSERINLYFNEDEFNSLMYHLDLFEDKGLQDIVKRYGYTGLDVNKTKVIGVEVYPSAARAIIYKLLAVLPNAPQKGYFEEYSTCICERDRAYLEKREQQKRELFDAIRAELLNNPTITGADIARNLKVKRSLVYEHWNDIKKEMGLV